MWLRQVLIIGSCMTLAACAGGVVAKCGGEGITIAELEGAVSSNMAGVRARQAGDPTSYVVGTGPQVIYRGTNGALHGLWSDGSRWHGVRNINQTAGTPAAAGDPTSYVVGTGPQVIYRDRDGWLHGLYWNGRRWSGVPHINGR